MENPKFEQVRFILRSQKFLNLSPEDKIKTFEKIIASGISYDELKFLIDEVKAESQQIQIPQTPSNLNVASFESLPYDVFSYMVLIGDIDPKGLFSLCSASKKLKEYCNRDVTNIHGITENQAIFKKLLDKMGIKLKPGDEPKEIYRKLIFGGDWSKEISNAVLSDRSTFKNAIAFFSRSKMPLTNIKPGYVIYIPTDKTILLSRNWSEKNRRNFTFEHLNNYIRNIHTMERSNIDPNYIVDELPTANPNIRAIMDLLTPGERSLYELADLFG